LNTYIATDREDTVILVVDGEIRHAINPNCPEWSEYEQHIADGGTLIDAQPSEAHVFIGGSWVLDERIKARLDLADYEQWKLDRADAVSKITVEVDGMIFDGDEDSQTRMSRAIVSMNDSETTLWKLNNNTVAIVSKAQLQSALRLAGENQTQLWMEQ
jgi:hypothetical protein